MKALFTPTTGVIRVFDSDAGKYGDKYHFSLSATLYDHGKVCYLEGLQSNITHKARAAIAAELDRIGVKYARWSHTNSNGHEVHVCVDVKTGRLQLE